jgi:hypothetical protein
MKDFDALPYHIRRALANADHNWSGTEFRRILFCESPSFVISFIRKEDKRMHEEAVKDNLICGGQR